MDDEEPRIEIKLHLSDRPQTKSNGKKSINAILANFKCGLPSPIKTNNAEFSLFKSRRDKNQLLLVEDVENEVLYYDKRIPPNPSSTPQQTKLIGVFDRDSNKINLLPVTYSFNMKSEIINQNNNNYNDDNDIENDAVSKHEDLVDTFGSKFAVKNMNKQQRLRKTKDATLAAMDRMDTAQLINDKDDDDKNDDNNNNDIYQTKNIPKQRKRKRKHNEMESEIEIIDDRDYSTNEHKEKYVNIFQHKFSKSPYCLFEYPYHQNAKKISKVYILNEIIPYHIWQSIDCDTIWDSWKNGVRATEFVQRCMGFTEQVKKRKGSNKFKVWSTKLALYDVSVRFIKSIYDRPKCVDKFFWQNLKSAYLEQYVGENNRNNTNKNKRIKYSMTRRGKMRIVGIILLLAIDIAFWKISLKACHDIAKDIQIPFRVIVEIYRLLGCSHDDKVIAMKSHIVHRNPTTTVDGIWWNVD